MFTKQLAFQKPWQDICQTVIAAAIGQWLVLGNASPIHAAAFFWNNGGATYNWTEGANWSTGVAPPNNDTAELFFGNIPFGGSYYTNADLGFPGFYQTQIGRIVFLPSAGAYTVLEPTQPPNVQGTANIFLAGGGIINESPNLQTFQSPVSTHTTAQTIDGGSGGLRFTDGIGFSTALILTGTSGAITNNGGVASFGPQDTTVTKSGGNTLNLDQGASMYLTKFNVTGGSVQFRGNQAGVPTPSPSGIYSTTVTGGASISVINGSDLLLGRVFAPTATTLQVNSGSVGVSGAGSSLIVARETGADPLLSTTVGNGGTGSLSFSAQATGAFDSLAVGGSSAGSLLIQSPAAVTGGSATIGFNTGASGSATVNGPNASWTTTSDIVVGQGGSGLLQITGGGKVSNLRTHFGFNSGSSGSVIVRDLGSSLTGSGSFFIGNGGTGSLQVLNGGVASTAGNSYLGFATTALGTAIVSGAGSTWNTASGLYIGGNAAAPGGPFGSYLRVEDGGAVTAGTITLYNTGTLELVNNTTLTGPMTSLGGLIRTYGNTALANNVSLGAGGVTVVNISPASTATFSGTLSGTGGLTKAGLGAAATLKLTGNNTYAGATTVNSGTLLVDGSITSATTVNSGATFGGSGVTGAVDVKSGGTIAPGNSSGALTTGNTVFRAGGAYQLDLLTDGTGTPGVDWDSLGINGTLDMSALSAATPFYLRLRTLDAGNSPNHLAAWNPATSHTWMSFVSTTGGFVGDFDPSLVDIDVTGFQNPMSGAFSVVQNGANLDLQYMATYVDPSVLVTNLQEPFRDATPIANPQYWGAQSFVPDSHAYTLTSIEAIVGNGVDATAVVAELRRSDVDGSIDQSTDGLLVTFAVPDLTGDPAARLFAPDAAVTLQPGTKYWFILGSSDAGTFDWSYANTALTLGPGSLSNYGDTSDAAATWDYRDDAFPYFIQVKVAPFVETFLEADFNEDGFVDSTDLGLWTANFGLETGATHINGDANADGDADGDDFLIWQRQLTDSQSVAAASPVPEPATVLLFIVAAAGLHRNSCRMRQELIGE